ncbi:MAG: HD domain-containing protein [bacterium]
MVKEAFERELHQEVKHRFEKSVPRYYGHTLQVVANMRQLMKKSQVDQRVLLAAAYLHDIGYSAPYQNDYVGNIKDQDLKIPLHSELGADIAREILRGLGMEPTFIERVAELVSMHHRQDINDEALQVLWRADQVD